MALAFCLYWPLWQCRVTEKKEERKRRELHAIKIPGQTQSSGQPRLTDHQKALRKSFILLTSLVAVCGVSWCVAISLALLLLTATRGREGVRKIAWQHQPAISQIHCLFRWIPSGHLKYELFIHLTSPLSCHRSLLRLLWVYEAKTNRTPDHA